VTVAMSRQARRPLSAFRRAPASRPGAGEPFWGRFSTELTTHPARFLGACLATVMGPWLLLTSTSASSVPAAFAGERRAATAAAPIPAPTPGDLHAWTTLAQSAAATCPGLPSQVLVAIASVESRFGQGTAPSAAGAIGPLQFLPATWAAYGVDADGDGQADVMNPVDAIHGATRLLCANGGADPSRLPSALWNYNHSDAYVQQVLRLAAHRS
jgi:soluble lytic murein transglycosylase-like protein